MASFDEGVLTLRFPRQGDVKGFQGSKYEDLLKQVINAMFGVNVVIRAVTGGGDAPSPARPPRTRPRPGPGRAAAQPPYGQAVVVPGQPQAAVPAERPSRTAGQAQSLGTRRRRRHGRPRRGPA